MLFVTLCLQCPFPERALIYLKREKIPLFHVKKVKKNQILFSIKRKHSEKVFAIYQKLWYNKKGEPEYSLKQTGGNASFNLVKWAKRRVGLLIGALLFACVCLFSQNFILQVRVVGAVYYQREIMQALDSGGLGLYQLYQEKNRQAVCAEIFKLDAISFCSIQKQGVTLIVEVRTNPFAKSSLQTGDLISNHDGEVISVRALRGTPQVRAGDKVRQGQTLVSGYFCKQSGEQVRVEVIASVQLACQCSMQIQAPSEEEAFAQAYLQLSDLQNIQIDKREIIPCEQGFAVTLDYTVWQAINL